MALNQPQKASAATPDIQRSRNILQETLVELKKTTWPTKEEATRLTMVVLAVVIAMSLYMGTLDALLSFLVSRFHLLK
jgi:preprotein translocase subunit SecE